MAAFGTYLQVSGFWKVTQIEAQLNETEEIDEASQRLPAIDTRTNMPP